MKTFLNNIFAILWGIIFVLPYIIVVIDLSFWFFFNHNLSHIEYDKSHICFLIVWWVLGLWCMEIINHGINSIEED